ncbi:MAG: tRNA (adenosine(37)-N6)-dimethylallyltransferase MiaA [Myxococcota bacterium]|nr:tRNA (adenosine(37)-N6)-dimethylallyltransferase MiaA [Myxococcota bacterium]
MVPPRLTVIQGATASGKSGLAVALAQAWDAEIIGADSMQVFRGMTVGTAAPTQAEQRGVPHHLIGCWDPSESVSVRRWSDAVDALVEGHPERRYVIVGGTNMWIRLWLQGQVGAPEVDEGVRASLERLETEELYLSLKRLDSESAAVIHARDRYRIVRALAHFEQTGTRLSQARQAHGWGEPRHRCFRLGLLPQRAWLHERINRRAEQMYRQGLVDEAVALRSRYGAIRPLSVLGYRDALELADGGIDYEEALHRTRRDTRRYAKNQETWLRKEPLELLGEAGALCEEDAEVLAQRAIALWSSSGLGT